MKADELMIFAPLALFVPFLAWGVWKQRKNPRLPFAMIGGVLALCVCLAIGMAGVVVGAAVLFVGCVLWGAAWGLIRLLRSRG